MAAGPRIGWNWAAFNASAQWFFRRGMYGWAALNVASAWIFVLPAIFDGHWPWVAVGAYLVSMLVAVPLVADRLHARHVARRAGAESGPRGWALDVGRRVISVALALPWLAIAALLFLQTMSDDNLHKRAQRGGASARELAAGIESFFRANRRYPDAVEVRSLVRPPRTGYEPAAWDAEGRRVVVTFRGGRFDGLRFVVESRETGEGLQWRCSSDLPERFARRVCARAK